jgi:exodeoxyribonuclease VII large subunit
MEPENNSPLIYSPAAVLNLFNNSIAISQTKRLIPLKGMFLHGKGGNYNGFYYDTLRDEASDAQITIIVPALIRNELQANKTVTVNGFITKRVVNNASRIDIQFTVTDLVAQVQNKYSDEDLKRITVQQEKAAAGYRDVDSYIKNKIINEQPFRIAIVIGKTGIIDSDIKHQLKESIAFYDLHFSRISLSSETEIIQALQNLDAQDFDLIAVSRGGGENLEIFNKSAIAATANQLRALFLTAIGHKEDNTLLQRVADKAFITPTAFGQYLNELYNETVAELQQSRAQLVDSVKKQLAAGYDKELDNLKTQLQNVEALKNQGAADMEKVHQERQKVYDERIRNYEVKVAELEKKTINWTVIIIAVIIGLIIGYLLKA